MVNLSKLAEEVPYYHREGYSVGNRIGLRAEGDPHIARVAQKKLLKP